MLDRFLFIGVGGSGGRTLRMLQRDVQSRLSAAGWHRELPEAWQFLHIDTPAHSDVSDAGEAGQIRYLGLTMGGELYRELDQQICMRSEASLRNYASWRPDPTRVLVEPDRAAGQYRAVGRIIASAAGARLIDALSEAVSRMRSRGLQQSRRCLVASG